LSISIKSNVRENSFWLLDTMNGSMIKKAYNDLKLYEQMDSASIELLKYQEKALDILLRHAVQNTEFYSQWNDYKLKLSRFPLTDKNLLRENIDALISKKHDKKKLFKMATSGSTGTPFVGYQDKNKKKRVNAEVIYYNEKVGYMVGKKVLFLRAVISENKKSKLEEWMQNIELIDVSKLSDSYIDLLMNKIENKSSQGSMLIAYASTYDALRDYYSQKGTTKKDNIYGMVSISEMLFDDTRYAMETLFNCKCVSRYSNQENGIIGQDDIENNTFILNEAHYIVEILKMDLDMPVEEGEIGRIVITDLYNYAMPIIRYDTGDVGSFKFIKYKGVNKKALTNFGGRKIDLVYDSDGNLLSPHKISVTFWSFPELKQFQFIQQGSNKYLVKLNVKADFTRQNELKEKLLALFGDGSIISFEYVDDIPVTGSGKRKYIVNQISGAEG
jgi:phenylacetate-CoA ligase